MATLVDRREVDPGVYREAWEEDARLYYVYNDTRVRQRMEYRKACRAVNPAIRRDQEALYGVGYLAPHERDLLEKQCPRLGSADPEERHKAWREFWQSSRSEPYRVVDRV